MDFRFCIDLPAALIAELNQAANETRLTPEGFAAQTLESALAARRLPNVSEGKCGPRLIGSEHEEPLPYMPPEEVDAEPLEPGEVFTLEDVSVLEDIT